MKTKKVLAFGVFTALAISAGSAYAGAGANVNACVYFATKPAAALTVSVTVAGSGTHCMNNTGNNASFTVTSAGLTCGSVGYVESKSSSSKGDLCATDSSNWPLSYAIANTAFSGATQTGWNAGSQNNSMNLNNQSAGTQVCGSQALCTSSSWTWNAGTQGPLFIIFQPGYVAK